MNQLAVVENDQLVGLLTPENLHWLSMKREAAQQLIRPELMETPVRKLQ